MSFVLGNVNQAFANAKKVTATVSGWTATMSRNLSEVTAGNDGGARYVPGLSSGSLAIRGPQDSVGQDLYGQLAAAVGVDNALILTMCPYGTAAGQMALSVLGDVSDLSMDATVSDAVTFATTAQADEMVDSGFIVHGWTAETATGNSASIDRVLPSVNGGVAVLHATTYTGFTNVAIKIQHSTDNSTWSDLVTFTTITAAGAQRLLIPAGTTVNRYVRTVTTVTGTGSVTFLVALEPR